MQPFRVNADREPDPGLVLLGSALYVPFRLVITGAQAGMWLAVPAGAPWLLSRLFHWPLSWTYAIWEMGAATAFVVAFTLRASGERPAASVDDWLGDLWVAGHWPFAVLAAAACGPWMLVRTVAAAPSAKDAPVPSIRGLAAERAPVSVPAPGAADKARSRHSAPPFRAAAPRP